MLCPLVSAQCKANCKTKALPAGELHYTPIAVETGAARREVARVAFTVGAGDATRLGWRVDK